MTLTERFRVKPKTAFSLVQRKTLDTAGLDKAAAKPRLKANVERLGELQDRLYAQNSWAVLVIFQAMDGAGKDSTIKGVLSGVNPQGCQVYAFKAPSDEELDHDYLWRAAKALPERGRIGVHNRSHYEEVIVTRVHPEILARQRLPHWPPPHQLWPQRFRQINDWERHLAENGTLILKFFLHISKDEQRRQFLERIEEPEKHWKFSPKDVVERAHWNQDMAAYEDAIRHTSTAWAPWFVIPADQKWFTRLAVSEIIGEAMHELHLRYPTVPPATVKEWAQIKAKLVAEGKAPNGGAGLQTGARRPVSRPAAPFIAGIHSPASGFSGHVLRIPRAQLLPDLRVAALPEALEVARDLHGAPARREELEGHGHLPRAQPRRRRESENLLNLH